jgi:hypothetical protein
VHLIPWQASFPFGGDLQTWDALTSPGGLLGREKGLPPRNERDILMGRKDILQGGAPQERKAEGTSQWGEGVFPREGSPGA